MQHTRTAIVTGGAQGIGKATVMRLLTEGWQVVMADVDAEAVADAAAELQPSDRLLGITCDVGREAEVESLIAQAVSRFGGLDLLVNNAAILRNGPLSTLSLEDWNAVLAVNLTGPFLCSKHAAPHLGATGGSIVNIGSTRALMSEPDTEAYSASKGGVAALTHALAMSLGPQVRVNCISPGWIEVSAWKKRSARQVPGLSEADHAQHPVGRVGRPEDVAALVAYLASSDAGFITGQNLVVDGGMTRKMLYVE